jgi:hypothetical protein
MMTTLVLIALSLTPGDKAPNAKSHMTVTQPVAGTYRVTYSSEHSRKASNYWSDASKIRADETEPGMPAIERKHF